MSTATSEDWTKEKCLQLIREFKARPILWDHKDPFYSKKAQKPVAWKEIGDAMEMPAEVCKHKLGIMMSSFRREKSKIMQGLREKEDVYISTWFAFKEMSFLIDKDNERIHEQAMDNDNGTGVANTVHSSMKNYITDEPNIPHKKMKRSTSRIDSDEESVDNIATHNNTTTTPVHQPGLSKSDRDEEISSFVSFIGNKMKKYSETTKNEVQQAICKIIFKADKHHHETTGIGNIIDDPLDRSEMSTYRTRNAIKEEYSDNSN